MNVIDILRSHNIKPTPQRIAVAEFVLRSTEHPSAEEVLSHVRRTCPTASRATVYNTLRLFTERGLLRHQVLREGVAVFDPQVAAHHHFVDEATGEIYDVPWDAVQVSGADELDGFEVHELQVLMRGRKKN